MKKLFSEILRWRERLARERNLSRKSIFSFYFLLVLSFRGTRNLRK
ncbi:HRDC domain-containing protein [Flavobacterium sp. LPB0248]|nr:HRDC domain-containing protein [Flavobacterium sp. LPB0248]